MTSYKKYTLNQLKELLKDFEQAEKYEECAKIHHIIEYGDYSKDPSVEDNMESLEQFLEMNGFFVDDSFFDDFNEGDVLTEDFEEDGENPVEIILKNLEENTLRHTNLYSDLLRLGFPQMSIVNSDVIYEFLPPYILHKKQKYYLHLSKELSKSQNIWEYCIVFSNGRKNLHIIKDVTLLATLMKTIKFCRINNYI